MPQLVPMLGLLGLFAASAPAATPPGDAIAHWESALGGATALAHATGAHLTAQIVAEGVPGTAEVWVTGTGYREVAVEHAATSERVDHAGHAWRRDWNHWVRELQGRDAADETTDAFLRGLVYGGFTRAALAAARVRDVGDDSTGALHRVALAPKGGVPCVVDLDRATGLPVRASRCAYDDTTTLAFDDWRPVGGVPMPFRIREAGRNERADTLWVDTAEPAGKTTRFERPASGASDVQWPMGTTTVSVPFNFDNEHVMVEGSVDGGPPLWWLFDTGADVTVVNRARLAQLGLSEFGASATSGGGGAAGSAFTQVASLSVGGVAVLDQRATVLDLGGLEKLYGMPMGGILGFDFITRFVIVVDYARHTFTLHPPGFRAVGGTAVPFVLEQGHPHVRGAVVVDDKGPIATDFVIDSGAAESANLTAPFVRAHRLLERARKTPPPAAATTPGMAGQWFAQTSVRGFLRGLQVGPVAVHDVPINLQQGTSGAYSLASFSGTVGQRVLSRFINTYDYGRGTITLVAGAAAGQPFAPRTTFGAAWLADGPAFTIFTVSTVRKDSPAVAAGFAKGDTLVALDGQAAGGLTLARVQQALREDGAPHTVDVRHADGRGERLTFTVRTVSIEDR